MVSYFVAKNFDESMKVMMTDTEWQEAPILGSTTLDTILEERVELRELTEVIKVPCRPHRPELSRLWLSRVQLSDNLSKAF